MAFTEWETPEDFFEALDKKFNFTVDVCANAENDKIIKYYDEYIDGLSQDWSNDIAWLNPPYDRSIGLWIKKAYESSQKGGTVVVLIQGRSTDTKWWHKYVMKSSEIRIIKDRLHFGKHKKFNRANISSVVVIFRPFCTGYPTISSIDTKGKCD